MAFRPLPASNELVDHNFIDLAANFNTPRIEAEKLLASGMSFDDIRELKRTLNGHGQSRLQ